MSLKQKTRANTIVSRDWPIAELPGLSQEEQLRLQNSGITTTAELIKHGKTPATKLALASKLQIHVQHIQKWVALADLARIPSVGTQYCGLLLHAGVISTTQLAAIPVHKLHKQILRLVVATLQSRDLCPSIEQVQQWSYEAKAIGD